MLTIDLTGKTAFVAGVADDQGFGWAIARSLAAAGADVYVGTWPPVLTLFSKSLQRGRFDESMTLEDGSKFEIKGIIPIDVNFDSPEDVPPDVQENQRYKDHQGYTISEAAERVKETLGGKKLDILVHSIAMGTEVKKPLLETSRDGYLGAMSASSYSVISLYRHFGPQMSKGGMAVALSYLAAERCIPGYGGGMSSAKAAMESDLNYLSYEMGRAYGVRVNVISAGPIPSRAGKAIGFMEKILDYTITNQPLPKHLKPSEVGDTVAFLASPLASAISGSVLYVDNGFAAMGIPVTERGTIGGDETSIHVQPGFKPPED